MNAVVPTTTRSAPAPSASPTASTRAQPAPVLDRHAGVGGDPLELAEVHGPPLAGAVEVDQVQPPGPLLHPPASGVERVGVVLLAPPEVALLEAHRLAAEHVDGGVQLGHGAHGVAPTAEQIDVKFRSSWRPWALDFSGWNCTP